MKRPATRRRVAKRHPEQTVQFLPAIVLALLPELEPTPLQTRRPALPRCKTIESLSIFPRSHFRFPYLKFLNLFLFFSIDSTGALDYLQRLLDALFSGA